MDDSTEIPIVSASSAHAIVRMSNYDHRHFEFTEDRVIASYVLNARSFTASDER
jgi:hypothetical protein